MNKQKGVVGVVLLVIVAVGILGGGGYYLVSKKTNQPEPIACTMEAKICPDGSAAGRTGPNCEFAACPNVGVNPNVQKGTLAGRVTVGPLCPVEPCNPTLEKLNQIYSSRKVFIYSPNTKVKVAEAVIKVVGDHGEYEISLDADSYLVGVSDDRSQPKEVVVKPNTTTTLDFDVDTGIR